MQFRICLFPIHHFYQKFKIKILSYLSPLNDVRSSMFVSCTIHLVSGCDGIFIMINMHTKDLSCSTSTVFYILTTSASEQQKAIRRYIYISHWSSHVQCWVSTAIPSI